MTAPFIDWPIYKPTAEKNLYGWLSHEEHFARLLKDRTDPIVIEIGSFYGKTAHHLLSTYPTMQLYCIDPWMPYAELTKYDMDLVFKQWQTNLWEFRDRVEALRMTSVEGLLTLENYYVDLVYIDGAHDEMHCYSDVAVASMLHPSATICGDDYNMPGVRKAVNLFAKENNLTIKHDTDHSSFWEFVQ